MRLGENIKRCRAEVGEELLIPYFQELEHSLEGVDPHCILNYDETGFVDDPGRVKAVFKRGTRHAEMVVDHSKTHTSVMFCVSAAGDILPPYIVFKAKNLYETWTEGPPPHIPGILLMNRDGST